MHIFYVMSTQYLIIIIIIKPRLTHHMSVTKEDESQAPHDDFDGQQ